MLPGKFAIWENDSWTNDPMIVKLGVIAIRIPDQELIS